MKLSILYIIFSIFIVAHPCIAEDEDLAPSPDKKFAVLSIPGKEPCLISLPTRKVVIDIGSNDTARTPSVLWSKDSNCFACWTQEGRVTEYGFYKRQGDSFVTLHITQDITLPFEASLKGKKTRCIGEATSAVEWLADDTLIINRQGTINFYNEDDEPDGALDYSYNITIHFDKNGNGHVVKIKKVKTRLRPG